MYEEQIEVGNQRAGKKGGQEVVEQDNGQYDKENEIEAKVRRKRAAEDAKQREKEKEFMKGLDYLRDIRLKIHLEEKKTVFGLIIQCIEFVIDWVTPLKNETKVIIAT